MNRRELLAAVGVGVAGGIAGCVDTGGQGDSPDTDGQNGSVNTDEQNGTGETDGGNGSGDPDGSYEHPGTLDATFATNGDYPADDDPADGLPPEFSGSTSAPDADPSTFETLEANGETVRLAPIDVVEAWYRRREVRFVDARGIDQYERSHVYGSVVSPARPNSTGGGLDDWPTDARIITYCGCPHHLSSIRAAGLQKAGFSNVFALDEGFGPWYDDGYPMGGTNFADGETSNVSEWRLEGVVESASAGTYAWASQGRQYEAAPIRSDGSFALHLKFADVEASTPVQVSTPAYTLTRPLGELADGTIRV